MLAILITGCGHRKVQTSIDQESELSIEHINDLLEQREKKIEQIEIQIEKLEKEKIIISQRRAYLIKQREQLDNLNIIQSLFYYYDYDEHSSIKVPMVNMTLKNTIKYPISKIYFEVILALPDRLTPLSKHFFDYLIHGGLNPQEEITVKIPLGMLGIQDDTPTNIKDIVSTITVIGVDGIDKNPIFDTYLSEEEEESIRQHPIEIKRIKDELKKLK